MDVNTWWIWMLLAAVFLSIEIFRSKTPFIWLSLSAAVTGTLALLDIEISGQIAVFLNLSGFLILLEKRFNEKYVFKKSVMTKDRLMSDENEAAADNIFRKSGPGWEIRYGDKSYTIKHSIGLEYIRNLIREQGNWIHSSDMKRMIAGESVSSGEHDPGDQSMRQKEDIQYENIIERLPLNKIKDLRDSLEEKKKADNFSNPEERAEQLEQIEYLDKYISSVTDNKGRSRKLYDYAETDRKSVSAALNRARKSFVEHPELHTHFQSFIKAEGRSFRYLPDRPIDWLTD